MGIDRRKFLKGAAVATAASTVFSPHAFAQTGSVRWRCASSFPKSLDTIFGGASTVAERVSAMTDGKFQIRPYEAGELVPGLQVLDAVQQGTVECGHTCAYYFIGKNTTLGFATSIPFGLSAAEHNAWMYHGGGLQLMRDVYDDFGIIQFPAGNTGAQMGGWFKKEVKTAANLKGLKIRIPGIGGQVMAKLGANVQVIPGGEVYLALDRGAIDAAEWVGPYDDEKLGLHKAAKFYYYPGWWEPGPAVDFIVNQKKYDALPKAYREILATACAEANISMMAEYDAKNQAALQRLQKGGTQLRRYSTDILKAASKATAELHAENSAKNASYKKVYTQWSAFQASVHKWHQINEKPMMDFQG
ncbi:TRAP transporter substrate-binding protein [Deinococcus knuensis]|uniref:Extracytoplasmic solute receptor protein n=1 Tax=Deinococcus knuensis TaxID=1837380 RepID=A0ABQ2SIC1_9DEIO|nr:TRAP transporter substrate-binding protein [Deinococcus knuensis]GGS30548.1 ABC transporter substrate-binding protein [Deinococcus knuensis]